MPIINGWYVSRRKFERDVDFLNNQGLSEQQTLEIQEYFYKRIGGIALIFMSIGALIVMIDDILFFISQTVDIFYR